MSCRGLILLFFIICLTGQACATGQGQTKEAHTEAPFYLWPVVALIDQHRNVTTRMDGPRCPMYPSCSAYASKAVEEGGLSGIFLFIDRLFFREFANLPDFYVAVPVYKSRRIRFYDPVSDALPLGKQASPSLLKDDF